MVREYPESQVVASLFAAKGKGFYTWMRKTGGEGTAFIKESKDGEILAYWTRVYGQSKWIQTT